MARYTFETTADDEAAIDAARHIFVAGDKDHPAKTNADYMAFVLANMLKSYRAHYSGPDAVKDAEIAELRAENQALKREKAQLAEAAVIEKSAR